MKMIFFSLILLSMTGHAMITQTDSTHVAVNALYLEAGGAAGYGSVNYERIFVHHNRLSLSARIGCGTYRLKDYTTHSNPDVLIPLAINACYGKNHKIECGAGQTIATTVQAAGSEFKPKRTTGFHTILSIGYRYQKDTNGLFFRCAYTPVIEFNRHFLHWAGISIGYSF
jgi:hypothetical protein